MQCHCGNHAWCHESWGLQCILIHLPFKKWQFLSCYNFVGKFIPVLNSLLSAFVHVCWATSVAETVKCLQFSSVQSLSRVWCFVTPWITAHQASLSITNSQSHSNSHPSSWWCHPAISSSVVLFSSCPQSLSASGSFPMSQLFSWGGQSTGVSALRSVLPMNTQDWSPLGWTGWISLQSEGLCQVTSKNLPALSKCLQLSSDQIRSVAQSCLTLCDPMNHSTPGLPVHHQLPEFTETQVHRVSDAIQPSHSLSSPSPTAPNPSQHQGLFQWVNSSREVAKVLEFQL